MSEREPVTFTAAGSPWRDASETGPKRVGFRDTREHRGFLGNGLKGQL